MHSRPSFLLQKFYFAAIYKSRDLTVNKRSKGNSRPSFPVATATIANPKSVDLTASCGGTSRVPPAVFLLTFRTFAPSHLED